MGARESKKQRTIDLRMVSAPVVDGAKSNLARWAGIRLSGRITNVPVNGDRISEVRIGGLCHLLAQAPYTFCISHEFNPPGYRISSASDVKGLPPLPV